MLRTAFSPAAKGARSRVPLFQGAFGQFPTSYDVACLPDRFLVELRATDEVFIYGLQHAQHLNGRT
eukprot:8661913-Alexandrium_andersonii.AAC.1